MLFLFVNIKRVNLLKVGIFLVFFLLLIRLIYLQTIVSEKLIHEGDMRSLRIQKNPMIRGTITDRMGRLLAISIPVDSVWISPREIIQSGGISINFYNWKKLSEILSISLDRLSFLLHEHATENFLYLVRHLDLSVSNHVSQLKLKGVYLQREFCRYYPSGEITAHLVGVTNIDNQGIEGVEKSFDSWLSGFPEHRIVRKDRYGRVIEDVSYVKGRSAKNIVLSIDERLQCLAYHELNRAISKNKAESGSIVLIDIKTGEILVMTNIPSYDPNNLSIANTSVMRNRAITDVFEPGSTVKPIVIMTALKHKIVNKDTIISTLPYFVDGYQVKDVVSYKKLTVKEILQKSSNVGVSKLALAMPASCLVNSYVNFGMGKITNIGLIGESKGIYPYNKSWSDIELATFSYGYGLMVTPLQLAKVYATIGGMGVSRSLSIFRIDHPSLVVENQVFSSSLVRSVVDMMENIVLSNESEYHTLQGYRVAVKTGTVKKLGMHGKYVNKYIAYTAGVGPLNKPRFALVVVINDPKDGRYYGRSVSGPVFSAVMGNTLKIMNVVPDIFNY